MPVPILPKAVIPEGFRARPEVQGKSPKPKPICPTYPNFSFLYPQVKHLDLSPCPSARPQNYSYNPLYIYIYIYMICMCIFYVFMYGCVCVSIYIYIYVYSVIYIYYIYTIYILYIYYIYTIYISFIYIYIPKRYLRPSSNVELFMC